MFIHPIRIEKTKIAKPTVKAIKDYYDKVGLKPIICIAPVLDDFRNNFGWLRNDIQQFLRTSDPALQASLVKNLEALNSGDQNKDATIEDVFDGIVPNTVQTPSDITRFARVLATRYEGKLQRATLLRDLSKKVDVELAKAEPTENVDVAPEL